MCLWLDVKVGGDAVVVVKCNSDVKEANGCGGGFVGKFDGRMYVVKCGDEVCKFLLSVCPNLKMSSIKRHHTRGLYGALCRAVASRDPINKFAYGGAILVPMAVPCL